MNFLFKFDAAEPSLREFVICLLMFVGGDLFHFLEKQTLKVVKFTNSFYWFVLSDIFDFSAISLCVSLEQRKGVRRKQILLVFLVCEAGEAGV